MKIKFKVASVTRGNVPVTATVNGREMRVLADGLEVELISSGGRSLTLPVYGDDLAEAEKLFVKDGEVTFTAEYA